MDKLIFMWAVACHFVYKYTKVSSKSKGLKIHVLLEAGPSGSDTNKMAKRGMTSEHASNVKREGHAREREFAALIGGNVIRGTGKADIELDGCTWSVKGATWAQIFLYRGMKAAELGPEFRECIDVFPDDRADYLDDKGTYKAELRKKMRVIAGLLNDDDNLESFLYRAMFANSVDYLVIQEGERFLEFDADDVVAALVEGLTISNSRGDQKVIFRLEGIRAALGEIEVRNDSDQHYRELKCRFNLSRLCKFLKSRCAVNEYLV
jgi:hypothetical protein